LIVAALMPLPPTSIPIAVRRSSLIVALPEVSSAGVAIGGTARRSACECYSAGLQPGRRSRDR
jgi:hypothetical protein